MMERQATKREYFVSVSLDEYVPEGHLLRAVDHFLDLREFRQPIAGSYTGDCQNGGIQAIAQGQEEGRNIICASQTNNEAAPIAITRLQRCARCVSAGCYGAEFAAHGPMAI